MTGLLRKEFYTLSVQMKSWIGVILFMVFYTVFMKSVSFLFAGVVIITLTGSMTAFSYDQASRWDSFAAVLPVSRRQIVAGRYLLSLCLLIGSAAACLAAGLLLNFRMGLGLTEILESMSAILTTALLLLSLLLPLLYQLGPEKARYVYMAAMVGIFILVFLLVRTEKADGLTFVSLAARWTERHPLLTGTGFVAAAGAVLGISFLISVKIYEKKDF